VRATSNGWGSHRDWRARLVSTGGEKDVYFARVPIDVALGSDGGVGRVDFCLRCDAGGARCWDNNNSRNYSIDVVSDASAAGGT